LTIDNYPLSIINYQLSIINSYDDPLPSALADGKRKRNRWALAPFGQTKMWLKPDKTSTHRQLKLTANKIHQFVIRNS